MKYIWIPLILFYGTCKGVREALKKKAMEKCSVMEVLFFYTFFAFLLTIPFAIGQDIFGISIKYHLVIFLKAFMIFIGWICAMNAMKRLPLSIYCVLDMSRMLFSIVLSIILLGETLGLFQGIGMVFVLVGVTIVNLKKDKKSGQTTTYKAIPLVVISCLLNAFSAIIDKYTLSTETGKWFFGDELLNDAQMQFWYMLYLSSLYGLFILARFLIKKEKINVKRCLKCPWIYMLSILFMLADKAMFIANSNPNSKVVTLTVLQQVSVIVSILLGKILYKEKHILYRICCAILIVVGIVFSVI
ncbi:MAG: DMT family transporter [Clostridia bacterium]|nr:DMT family transporter [Clostridia bacterium]